MGVRVVIPEGYRVRLLNDLHEEHHGVCRMKSMVRSYFKWPGLDSAIGKRASAFHACAVMWKCPVKPWECIHIDFFFEKRKLNFLIVDAYSKWLEIIRTRSTTSLKTLKLCPRFARYGIPEVLVSDNGKYRYSGTPASQFPYSES